MRLNKVELRLAIGYGETAMIGPKDAIAKVSKYVSIKPGHTKKKDAANKIKTKLEKLTGKKIDREEIMSILPTGNIKIEK